MFKVTKDNFDDVIDAVNDLCKKDVLVGIPSDAPPREGETMTSAAIGYVHEYGSPAKNIPARPFLVPGVEDSLPEVNKAFAKAGKAALEGNQQQVYRWLNIAGQAARDSVKNKISSNIQPALSKRTLEARRKMGVTSTNTLIRTAAMKNAVNYDIRDA